MAKPLLRVAARGLLGLAAVGLLAAALGYVGLRAYERHRRPDLDERLASMMTYVPPTTVEVTDRHGDALDAFGVERRIWVPLSEMPEVLRRAVIAAEDRRFWDHGGVDPLGIARAALANARSGRIVEGGSTLTQQLVKKLVVGEQRTYSRKLEEALLARRIEERLSKEEILELYLNYTYLGSGNYGVEAASRDYFGVGVSEIDTAQAALLASLIPAPSRYSPRLAPELARSQRRRVLFDLVEVGELDAEEALALSETPIDPPRRDRVENIEVGHAYRTAVRRQVRELFTSGTAHRLGLKIETPYDPRIQEVAEHAVRRAVEAVEARQGRVAPSDRIATLAEWQVYQSQGRGLPRAADGSPREPQPGDCFEAMLARPYAPLIAGPYRVSLRPEDWGARVVGAATEEPLVAHQPWGTLFQVCLDGEQAVLTERDWVEGAAVVIENATGGVVALVGGRGMALEGFNHATQARRQPGSTFKPYVVGAALEQGSTQLDTVLDAPLTVGGWSPRNAGGYYGETSIRTALTFSLNTAMVRLMMDTGVEAVRDFATRAGVATPLRDDLTVALGSSEITVLDQATGYATFARDGRHTEPVFLSAVDDLHGTRLGEAGDTVAITDGDAEEPAPRLPGPDGTTVIQPGTAGQLVDVLAQVVRSGTGRRAWHPDRARAGKTGTTSHSVDTWFAGMIPSHTVVVWIGSDDNVSLGRYESGGRTALPAWIEIVEALEPDTPTAFDVPASVMLMPLGDQLVRLPRVGDIEASLPDELPAFPTQARPPAATDR